MKTIPLICALALVFVCLASGCQVLNLNRPATAQGRSPLRPARPSPDSVAMEIVWARFPMGNTALNESIWQYIDETRIEPAVARELATNGFRAGVLTEALPEELTQSFLTDEAKPNQADGSDSQNLAALMVEPTIRSRRVQARRRRRIEIQASEIYPSIPLLTAHGAELSGGTFHEAQAIYTLEVEPQVDRTVLVQLTPELHHGVARVRWRQSEEGILRQASMKEHEVFDRLRLQVKLAPGESLVLMSLPNAGSRLGPYFHTVESAEGRQLKVILIRLAEVPPSDTFVDAAN